MECNCTTFSDFELSDILLDSFFSRCIFSITLDVFQQRSERSERAVSQSKKRKKKTTVYCVIKITANSYYSDLHPKPFFVKRPTTSHPLFPITYKIMREGSYYSHHSVFFLEVYIRFIRFTSLCIVYRDGVDGVDLRHVINFFFKQTFIHAVCVYQRRKTRNKEYS